MPNKSTPPGSQINNCTFTNTTAPTPLELISAIESLAAASKEHAISLGKMADVLKGPNATMTGIRIEGNS